MLIYNILIIILLDLFNLNYLHHLFEFIFIFFFLYIFIYDFQVILKNSIIRIFFDLIISFIIFDRMRFSYLYLKFIHLHRNFFEVFSLKISFFFRCLVIIFFLFCLIALMLMIIQVQYIFMIFCPYFHEFSLLLISMDLLDI